MENVWQKHEIYLIYLISHVHDCSNAKAHSQNILCNTRKNKKLIKNTHGTKELDLILKNYNSDNNTISIGILICLLHNFSSSTVSKFDTASPLH